MPNHPVFDHHIVHQDSHVSRVRIVANADAAEVAAELRLLFPREAVLATAIGCCHQCVYTDHTPASLVAERIAEHVREVVSHGDFDPAPRHLNAAGERSSSDEPLPDFFGPEGPRR